MKILFLDVDGVLNCRTTPVTDGWPLDPHKVLLLHRILEKTGAQVVLSSSWRHSDEGIDVVNRALAPFKILDHTHRLDTSTRGNEIGRWIFANSLSCRMDNNVEQYAILDDDSDMLQEQLPNFFKTTWEQGLTEEIAEAVTKHLTGIVLDVNNKIHIYEQTKTDAKDDDERGKGVASC